MTYVKTYLPTLKTHVVNLKRDAKDLSRDLQRLEVPGKLESKTLYYLKLDWCMYHIWFLIVSIRHRSHDNGRSIHIVDWVQTQLMAYTRASCGTGLRNNINGYQ